MKPQFPIIVLVIFSLLAPPLYAPEVTLTAECARNLEKITQEKYGVTRPGFIAQKAIDEWLLTQEVGTSVQLFLYATCKSCKNPAVPFNTNRAGEGISCPSCNKPIEIPKPGENPLEHYIIIDGEVVYRIQDIVDTPEEFTRADYELWGCPYCKVVNSGDREKMNCNHCGAAGSGRETVSTATERPVDINRFEDDRAGINARPRFPQEPLPAPRKGPNRLVIGVSVAGGALGVFLFARWAFKTRKIVGDVKEKNWTHTQELLIYTPVKHTAWKKDITVSKPIMPVNGIGEFAGVEILNEWDEVTEYKKVPDGTEWVDEEYIVYRIEKQIKVTGNKKNGTEKREVVEVKIPETKTKKVEKQKYKRVPSRWEKKVEYRTFEWQHSRNVPVSGINPAARTELIWPQPLMGEHEKLGSRSQSYEVVIDYEHKGHKTYRYKTTDQDEFLRFRVGGQAEVTYENLRGAISATPIND